MSPNNQKVISASFISSSAKYFNKPTNDDIRPPTANPHKIKTTLLLFLNDLEISNVKMTAINPKINDADPIKGADKITVDEEKALKWLSNGAQPTDTVKNILSHAGVMAKYAESKKKTK